MKKIVSLVFLIGLLIGCDNPTNTNIPSLLFSAYYNSGADVLSRDNDITRYKVYPNSGKLICFMGDSRIEKYNINEYFPTKNLINYGRKGSTTRGLINRIDTVIKMNPDVIIISIGANNILRLLEYRIIEDIRMAIKAFKQNNPDVIIYVLNIMPFQSLIIKNNLLKIYNPQIKTLCEEEGVSFLYVDILETSRGSLNPDYSLDGIHYNELGYQVFTEFLKNNIAELN